MGVIRVHECMKCIRRGRGRAIAVIELLGSTGPCGVRADAQESHCGRVESGCMRTDSLGGLAAGMAVCPVSGLPLSPARGQCPETPSGWAPSATLWPRFPAQHMQPRVHWLIAHWKGARARKPSGMLSPEQHPWAQKAEGSSAGPARVRRSTQLTLRSMTTMGSGTPARDSTWPISLRSTWTHSQNSDGGPPPEAGLGTGKGNGSGSERGTGSGSGA